MKDLTWFCYHVNIDSSAAQKCKQKVINHYLNGFILLHNIVLIWAENIAKSVRKCLFFAINFQYHPNHMKHQSLQNYKPHMILFDKIGQKIAFVMF